MPPNLREDLDLLELDPAQQLVDKLSVVSTQSQNPSLSSDDTNNQNDWENVLDLEAPTESSTKAKDADEQSKHKILTKKTATLEGIPRHSNHDATLIKEYIRRQSTCLSNRHRHASAVDQARLAQATKDAGFYAFGVLAVEVWVLNEDNGCLERPRGGWWGSEFLEYLSPVLAPSDDNDSSDDSGNTLTCMPGVGLAGVLWAESSSIGGFLGFARDSQLSLSGQNSTPSLPDAMTQHHHPRSQVQTVRWRDLKSLLEDPDTPKDARFNAYLASGFGLAAGVPFQSFLCKGLVLYLARATADVGNQMDTTENRVFLDCSAHTIGAVLANSQARRACLMRKQLLRAEAFRKVQHGLVADYRCSIGSRRDKLQSQSSSLSVISVTLSNWKKYLFRRFRGWRHKCRGGNLQIPPPMTWDECFYTLLGCFLGLLVLSTINELAMDMTDNELNLLIGPFGALMTLLYGLSSAPASQPRNVILGQVVAGAVSLSFTYIPDSVMSTWMRRAIGPAVAITTMVKLGIPHPPAGAHSVIYASGLYGWKFYFLVVLSSIISVAPATMVNNLSQKRQYPTFWDYVPSYFMTRIKRWWKGVAEK